MRVEDTIQPITVGNVLVVITRLSLSFSEPRLSPPYRWALPTSPRGKHQRKLPESSQLPARRGVSIDPPGFSFKTTVGGGCPVKSIWISQPYTHHQLQRVKAAGRLIDWRFLAGPREA